MDFNQNGQHYHNEDGTPLESGRIIGTGASSPWDSITIATYPAHFKYPGKLVYDCTAGIRKFYEFQQDGSHVERPGFDEVLTRAINRRGAGDLENGAYQIGMTQIKRGDFWVMNKAPAPPPMDSGLQNGDWVIAIVDNPGSFDYSDTTKWMHMPFGRIFNIKGAWSAGTYPANTLVENGGSAWISMVETSQEPVQGATDWQLLVSKGEKGDPGDQGEPGAAGLAGEDGREVELQLGATHIEWRYSGDTTWNQLISIDTLKASLTGIEIITRLGEVADTENDIRLNIGLEIGTETQPKTLKIHGVANTTEKEIDITGQNAIGSGTTKLIDVSAHDKYRFINADQNLMVNDVTSGFNGCMFTLVIVAAGAITVSFSTAWGELESVDLAGGDRLMVSGYISGGAIIAAHNKPGATQTVSPPVIDSFSLDGGMAETTDGIVTLDLSLSGGVATEYMVVEDSGVSPDWSGISWQDLPTAPLVLSAGNEVKRVWIKVRNAGGESAENHDEITQNIPLDAPTANAGSDATICEAGTKTLDEATANNYESLLWTTNGDGTFDDASALNPVYTPGAGDVSSGGVTLTLTVSKSGFSDVQDSMILTLQKQPVCNAGGSLAINEGSDAVMTEATASGYSSLLWSTSGDGTFDDATAINPTYTPGSGDIANRSVTLTLTASAVSPCTGTLDDSVLLTINDILAPAFTLGASDNGDGTAGLTLTETTSPAVAATMKILDVAQGGASPDQATWEGAGVVAFASPHTYSPASAGDRTIYVRVYNQAGEYSEESTDITIAAGQTGPLTVHKISLGESATGWYGSGWNEYGMDVEPYDAPLTEDPVNSMYDENEVYQGLRISIPTKPDFTNDHRKSQGVHNTPSIWSHPDVPAEKVMNAIYMYGNQTDPGGRYHIEGLNVGHTYRFRLFSTFDTGIKIWAVDDSDVTYFKLIGATTVSDSINPRDNTGQEVVIEVQPDASGMIILDVTADANWDYSIINAMIIEEYA